MLTLSVREREALGELALAMGENDRAMREVAYKMADILLHLDEARSKLERLCTGIDERNRPPR
jgi:hypothetical protein